MNGKEAGGTPMMVPIGAVRAIAICRPPTNPCAGISAFKNWTGQVEIGKVVHSEEEEDPGCAPCLIRFYYGFQTPF